DPDADDVEYADQTSEIDQQDQALDVEMEDAESSTDDGEDAGLVADADVPIEDLLKRYGYTLPEPEAEQPSVDIEIKPATHEAQDTSIVAEITNGDIIVDQSLTDEVLAKKSPTPGLIIEGKRQRRARAVWSPTAVPPPPPPPPSRPKVVVIKDDEEVEEDGQEEAEEHEDTPEMTSEEEITDDEDEMEVDEDEIHHVRQPILLRGTLRPYQQAGLEWLASLYANNMNGILADEMGLGKTIQTIALLGHLACDKGVWGQHLIIVPTSVILNWEMEFKKFFPGMKVLTYYGNQKERKDKRVGWHTENAWQVCITSYQIVLADQHIFRRKSWVYMILDEAHNIKNFRSQRWQTLLGFKAQRRLLLTGTPLQNNLMELWSLLYFLMPNGVTADATAVVGFANHKEFMEWFSNPMDKAVESGDTLDEGILETVAKLHTLLRPFILRRLKSEVETQLPGKFEHVVYCKLSKRQRFLYDEFMSRASTKEALTSGGYLGVVNTLMQLRKVCNHPDLFEVRPVRTSFAMERSVVADYEPCELLIRRRLLSQMDEVDLQDFLVTSREGESAWVCRTRRELDASDRLPHAIELPRRGKQPQGPKMDTRTLEGWLRYKSHLEEQASKIRWRSLRDINQIRCRRSPIYGTTLLSRLSDLSNFLLPSNIPKRRPKDMFGDHHPPVSSLVISYEDRAKQMIPITEKYAVIPPTVVTRDMTKYSLPGLKPISHPEILSPSFDTLHHSAVKLQIAFPDSSLLQYDCGKLQKLYEMLRQLKINGHRIIIFTQMTRVLDILEMFLSYNGHRYLRLDGSTKIEDRQILTERFNSDSRIFVFIASSRSGGVGINLTGADTVFFYDSDWNPSMDRQCMDRAHRIGQTREVNIYRFVSSHTVEENMLKKANQKRLLDKMVIQQGDFTTEFFGKMDWRDMLDENEHSIPVETNGEREEREEGVVDIEIEKDSLDGEEGNMNPRIGEEKELVKVLEEVEDVEDAEAARLAQGEVELDFQEFTESRQMVKSKSPNLQRGLSQVTQLGNEKQEQEEEEEDVGGVDEYMLKMVEWDWEWFSQFK
ncbi:hypothetical protein TREMEDRAFT_11403, partial [Tremella mesenterica DSM 1558]|uniref:uncharacterized protein n=1 Tax=Tremella mesenterica (strain ATCC 24925 / CBS 8224 / DSM 1558 / NBRC 9311 / NRRL Y-6157 / RJB 2259-6 / UBC 559-6) TaxID=578456 RepID=UPI0003F49229